MWLVFTMSYDKPGWVIWSRIHTAWVTGIETKVSCYALVFISLSHGQSISPENDFVTHDPWVLGILFLPGQCVSKHTNSSLTYNLVTGHLGPWTTRPIAGNSCSSREQKIKNQFVVVNLSCLWRKFVLFISIFLFNFKWSHKITLQYTEYAN